MSKQDTLFPGFEDAVDDIPLPTRQGGETVEPLTLDPNGPDIPEPAHADIVIDINKNREGETVVVHGDDTRQMLLELDRIDLVAKNMCRGLVGTEDFASVMKNAVYGIVNIVGHIVSLFTTYLFDGWRDFKRGEVTEYLQSNVSLKMRMNNAEFYNTVMNTEIETPQGMKGTYPEALKSLTDFLNELNMLKRSRELKECFSEISDAVADGMPKNQFNTLVMSVNKVVTNPKIKTLYDKTGKFFTDNKDGTGIVKDHFSSHRDFIEFIENVSAADEYLREIAAVYDNLMAIENDMNDIYRNSDKVDKNQLTNLAVKVRQVAEIFDQYATVCNDLNRVGHNTLIMLEDLRAVAQF